MIGAVAVSERVEVFLVALLALLFYSLPTAVATSRKVVNVGSVFVINLSSVGASSAGWLHWLWQFGRSQQWRKLTHQTDVAGSPQLPPPGFYADAIGSADSAGGMDPLDGACSGAMSFEMTMPPK